MAGNAGAAGFRLAEQDAAATGMGNSFTAVADNASAVWYNPAAMTDLAGTNIELGSVMISPSMSHANTSGSIDSIKNNTYAPPHAYVTQKIGNFAIGAGVNAPFGLSTNWDDASNTSLTATYSQITDVNYNFNAAYKASDKLSFAVGADYAKLNATLNNTLVDLSGDGHGWGYNAAAFYKLNDKWNFGANYRSSIKIDIDGTATAMKYVTSANKATTKLTLPDTFQLGAAYKMDKDWLFSGTVDYTDWSTYHVLNVKSNTFTDLTTFLHTYVSPAYAISDTNVNNKDWNSVWAFRLGTEYKVSDAWKIRSGVFYDMNPVPNKHFETRIPDSDRAAWSIGAGYTKGSITVDASYMYLRFIQRSVTNSDSTTASTADTTLNGKYNASASMPALSVSYKF